MDKASRTKKDEHVPEELARKRARDRKSQRAMRERTHGMVQELEQRVAYFSGALAEESAAHQAHIAASNSEIERLRAENHILRVELENVRSGSAEFKPSSSRSPDDPSRRPPASMPSARFPGKPPLPAIQQSSTIHPKPTSTELPYVNLPPLQLSRPRYQIPPWNTEPTCLGDRIIQGYIEWQRKNIGNGQHPNLSEELNVNAILAPNPTARAESTPSRVSTVVSDFLRSFHEIDTVPKKASCFYIICVLLEWLIYRNEATYEQLPSWLRPVPIQLKVPHPAWIDRVPWPGARTYLIEHQDITFHDFASVYSSSFEITWPSGPAPVVVLSPTPSSATTDTPTPTPHSQDARLSGEQPYPKPRSHASGLSPYISSSTPPTPNDGNSGTGSTVGINPVYEQHLRQLKNWAVGEPFRRKFPEMSELVDQDRAQSE